MYMLHSEWTSPLGISAPVWGIISLIGYVLIFQVVARRDKA